MRHASDLGRDPVGTHVEPARKAGTGSRPPPPTKAGGKDILAPAAGSQTDTAPAAGAMPRGAGLAIRPAAPRVDIVTPAELDDGLVAAWRALQTADPDLVSPFFSPEFCRIVADVRGDVRIAVISDSGGPVGFLPYHRQRFGRLAPLAGQISDYHGIVGSDGGLVPVALLRALRAQVLDFNHLPASQTGLRDHAFLHTTSPLVDLSDGFEAWRQACRARGSAIKNAERKGRKLSREVGPLRFVANETDPAVWDRLRGWKRAALAGIGVPFILDRPWAGAVVDHVRATDTPGFGGMTSALWAGDTLAAVTFSMRTDATIHSWFPTYNPALERYSPGLTLLMETLRHAGAAGFREVDLGRGSERYKTEFANRARGLSEGSVERAGGPLGLTRKLRKAIQDVAKKGGKAEHADLARRTGNRLLSAGRISEPAWGDDAGPNDRAEHAGEI